MSWLSTSFSENLTNITGQISTFTKDMLTEGTVEVEDHETELKIVKSRVRELELTLFTQREEYDRVKELNHELEERAEATELQISSISREYRVLLQERENEVSQLREQLETWKENGSKQHHERLPSFNEDSFVDSTSQDEVQYLEALVNKLQEEKQQWSKQNESENLHKELDHYQHELATLHTTYSQRIATLNKKHKQEIEELESFHQEDSTKIQELEQQLANFEKNVGKTEYIALESESDFEIIKKESTENDLQSLSNEQPSSSASELKIIIDRLESENRELEERIENFVLEATQKDSEISCLRQENSDLSEKLDKSQKLEAQRLQTSDSASELARLQQDVRDLTEQRDQAVVSEAQTSASLESLREELSRLGAVTMELMKEVEQSQGVDKEKSIEIESLKKLCQVRRVSEADGSADEVMKLKDMLAVLWQKYSSAVLENEKVRLDVINLKRRLLNQLQDRHGDTQSLLNGLSEARTKLTNQIEGQQEENNMEKDQLISLMPGVENNIENHEESVSRLVQQHDENKIATKEIVNDFGRRWSVSNHVASLQSEKAVLERTIVGLEEKVQELEKRFECVDTPRSSVSTVVSVDSIRAAPRLPEDDGIVTPPESEEYGLLTQNTGESRGNTTELETDDPRSKDDDNEGYHNCSNEGSNKDYDMLMDRLREYEEMIQEFELIKEDWEGEKEALESVVVQLRQKLKEATSVDQFSCEKEKRFINDIEELLVKKNYISDEELRKAENSREELVLSYVLDWMRKEKNRQELIIETRDADQCYMTPGAEDDLFQKELGILDEENTKDCQVMNKQMSDEITDYKSDSLNDLHATKTELTTARGELDETNAKLNETMSNLDKTRIDNKRLNVEVEEAKKKVSDLESKLKILRNELEKSEVNINVTISEKDKEIHKLRNMVEQLQETLSNFENDKGTIVLQLQNEIGNLQEEVHESMLSCETMATKLKESKQELALVLDSRNSLSTQLSEMVQEKERLLGMVNGRDARIEELQDACDSVNQRMSFLQDEGKEKSKAFSELSEENSFLKEEKSDLSCLLETKEIDLSNSLREAEKLSDLLREQELASEEMKRQNSELAKELENWRVQLDNIKQTKEALNRELDAKSEEIMSLKENSIELANQSYENSAEISQKLSMLEELVSENSSLKSKNETLIEAISEKRISEKKMMDSYNLLVREKEQLDLSFSTKSAEMDVEIRRKIDEVEVLRLEVARLTKESHEKDHVIRTQVSANLVSGSDNDVIPKQEHIRRILQEKDVEIDALRTKNESLLTLFAENEDEKRRSGEEHRKQIASMLEREARMFNEINEKNDQIIALEDRLEMLNIKSASKDQASALIHAEHQKLLHLNESQSEEIGRLREKVATLGLLVAERDHSVSGEVQRLRQRNSDLQAQVDALQGEQERLLGLVHDKDKQLLKHETSNIVEESPIRKSQQIVINATPSQDNHLASVLLQETPVGRSPEELGSCYGHENLSQSQGELRSLFEENQKLSKELTTLRNSIASLNDSVETERKNKANLVQENNVINQRLQAFQATKMEDDKNLRRLQLEGEKLREELSGKERQILAGKEENNRRIYEINTLKNEKEELLLQQSSQVEGLQSKLSSLLDVITGDVDLKDEQFEILENRDDFEKLVNRVKSHRARLLSDKENEVRCLKEQVETLSSVQNISDPQLEAKLEQFMDEKDMMNQKMTEMENEKIELLELKENEMMSLQTQVVDLSNILKQKERKWLAERDALSENIKLLEKRSQMLEQERDSLIEIKVKSENEISILQDEVSTLSSSADEKLDVVLHEKDRRVKDLERELEHLNHRCSQSLKNAQDMKNELETSKQLTKEFEVKKEKELERLRTHLLQVEDSYTQEALASEERENELRNQLEAIQQQLLTSSHSLQDSNRTASMKMENLQEQLINITAHRDEVQAQLEQSQEQTLQYMRSVENLQMVLEQFQREKESELRNLHEKNREQLNEVRKEETRLRGREQELQQLLQNASDTLNKAERMGQDLKIKDDEIENLRLTIANLESDLQSSHDKLRKLTSNSDNKIEKGLMKNMLLAYFNTSEHKRCEVVGILGHILNFTEDEIKKVGTGSQPPQSTGWFSGLLSYSGSNQSQQQHDKSFSELFVSFLEKESEKQLMSQSEVQPPSSGSRPPPAETRTAKSVTAIPARLRDSPLPISPLASSTPVGNTRSVIPLSQPVVTNPLLMNAGKEEVPSGSNGTGTVDNALLGSSLRTSLDLPKISTSSSTALRQILFNN